MMARSKLLLILIPCLTTLSACSPSPLYVDRAQIGSYGDVPRDGRGEPVWGAIAPPPLPPVDVPQPVPSMGPN